MKVSFISEFETIGYGRTYAVNRIIQRLEEKGITVYRNNGFKDADIIHAHSPLHIAHYVLNKYPDKKFVGTIHANPNDFKNAYVPFEFVNKLSWDFYKKFYSKFDLLITPTKHVESAMRTQNFEKVITISNGIDLRTMRRNNDLKKHFEDNFGLKDFVFVIGRINDPRKDLKTAIKIASETEYEFAHAGEILPIFPTSFAKRLFNHIKAPPNFNFLGYLSQTEMIGAYNSAKVFLQCSKFETEGLVVLEALGCGTAIVARDIPAYHGLLKDRKNCFLCQDTLDLKEKLSKLIEHPKIRERFIKNGRNAAKARSLDKTANKYIHVYEEILNGKS